MVGADGAPRAGPVVDDNLLAQFFRCLLADGARQDIGGAPGRKRHDQAHRFDRVGLGLGPNTDEGSAQPHKHAQ